MPFVVFEGPEACGKSTQLHLTHQWLQSRWGTDPVVTREPGGTPLAEDIRSLFKRVNDHADDPIPLTEALLVSAARAQHCKRLIETALDQQRWVLCDRFVDSSLVYQGIMGGVDRTLLQSVSEAVIGQAKPDLVLVFALSPKLIAQRLKVRHGAQPDRLDSFPDHIHEQINLGYHELVLNKIPYFPGFCPNRVLIECQDLDALSVHEIVKQHILASGLLKPDHGTVP